MIATVAFLLGLAGLGLVIWLDHRMRRFERDVNKDLRHYTNNYQDGKRKTRVK